MTGPANSGERIAAARKTAGLSQRRLAKKAGLAQATLSRIEQGERAPKLGEVLSLSWVLGCTVTELTGLSTVRERVECVARASENTDMASIKEELIHFLELDAYLDDQGIPQPE